MPKDIKFNIKLNIDGKEQVVSASTTVRELAENIGIAKSASRTLATEFRDFAQFSVSLQGINNAIQGLASQMQEFTQAYATQQQAETQLQTVMQNTMGATREQVQAIMDLCSAQQQLGVVGDEVQLAGAKELAMHLKSKDTLAQLIPIMNDLAVKQDGCNVSASTAASVASMIGKAMDGNITALKRAGIALTDAQKEILKTGTEAERSAVLVQALGEKVGGMNEQMAQTDAGRMQQLSNTIGDLKEKIGAMVGSWAPVIQTLAQIGVSVNGIFLLIRGVKTLIVSFRTLSIVAGLYSTSAGRVAIATRGLSAALVAAKVSANGLKYALRGLMTSTGVGIAIAAICWAIGELMNAFDEASDKANELGDATADAGDKMTISAESAEQASSAYTNTLSQNMGKLMGDYTRLQEEWKKLTDAHSKMEWIAKNADAFRQLGLDVHDVVSAEIAFVKNTDAVKKAFEARARFAAAQAQLTAEFELQYKLQEKLQREQEKARQDAANNPNAVKPNQKYEDKFGNAEKFEKGGLIYKGVLGDWRWTEKGAAKYNEQFFKTDAGKDTENAIRESQKRVDDILGNMVKEGEKAANEVTKAPLVTPSKSGHHTTTNKHGTTTEAVKLITDPKTKSDFENNIKYYREQLSKTPETNTAKLSELREKIEEAQKHIDAIDINSRRADLLKDISKDQEIFILGQEKSDGGLVNWVDIFGFGNKKDQKIKSLGHDFLRDFYSDMQNKAQQLQSDYSMGLISEDRLRDQIKKINDMLEAMHLKPIKLDIDIEVFSEKTEMVIEGVNQMGSAFKSFGSALKETKLESLAAPLDIAGTLAQAIATTTLAYATASAQAAKLGPFAWLGFGAVGLAQLAAVISSMKNLNKFAEGGIAYGPTLGLFGEYAGASHNPEVVAPLDKLRSMIQPAGFAGNVRFRIEGRELVGVLANETRTSAKAGGRTNIKI